MKIPLRVIFRKEVICMTRQYKHLTYSDREDLLKYVSQGLSLRTIGTILNKSASTLSRELKLNRSFNKSSQFNQDNRCALYKNCLIRSKNCFASCPKFKREVCNRLQKAPWICAGCPNIGTCRKSRTIYNPKQAHARYEELLASSRKGPYIGNDALLEINNQLKQYLKLQKQSLYHLSQHTELGVSSSTIYRYISKGYLPDISNMDLPRKIRYRQRVKRTKHSAKEEKKVQYKGRTYADYLVYTKQNPRAKVAQLDSVEGPKGMAVLLTIHLLSSNFMMAFKRTENDNASVLRILSDLKMNLGTDYNNLINVILPDRGTEFTNPSIMEEPVPGHKIKSHVFYCDPRRSDQKGSCEKNHQFIRYFVPQGKPFDHLSQDQITAMMNNINSVKREYLNGKSPFECLTKKQKNALKKLGYTEVPADEVILSSCLFTK